MSTSRKKVIIRQFDGFLAWGYLPSSDFVRGESIELLDTAGKVAQLFLANVKTIAYVKDFNLDDRSDPERIGRRSFQSRPRGEGLWLRLDFHDHDALEGVSHFDMGFLESVEHDLGFSVLPPDGKSNTQRIFVPRSALAGIKVLGLIGVAAKAGASKSERLFNQGLLFEGR